MDLCLVYYATANWPGMYYAIKQLLRITEKPFSYICEPDAWGGAPYDFASLAAYSMGLKSEAVELCERAIELEPNDERIRKNLTVMQAG